MASDDPKFKEVTSHGGTLRFRVPAEWAQKSEAGGITMFFNRSPEFGLFSVGMGSGPWPVGIDWADLVEGFRDTQKLTDQETEELSNGKVLVTGTKRPKDHGVEAISYCWVLAHPVPGEKVILGLFTYTIAVSQTRGSRVSNLLRLLDREIRATRFVVRPRLASETRPPESKPPRWKFWAKPPKPAAEVFEEALKAEGIQIQARLDSGLYQVLIKGQSARISLDNAARDYQLTKNPEVVRDFASRIVSELKVDELPPWEEARSRILFHVARGDGEIGDSIRKPLTEKVVRVLVLDSEKSVRFLKPGDLEQWQVTQEEVDTVAQENMRRLMLSMEFDVHLVDGRKLGFFNEGALMKAATILCPNFKDVVADRVGWPVLVIMPNRDFICVTAERDGELPDRFGEQAAKDYGESSHPLTLEVLRISDDGIEVVGKFEPPEEA